LRHRQCDALILSSNQKTLATLGLDENPSATSGTWADLRGGGGSLGIHIAQEATTHTDAAAVVLQFTTDERLEITAKRLAIAGYAPLRHPG
jgi:hypothetical protein